MLNAIHIPLAWAPVLFLRDTSDARKARRFRHRHRSRPLRRAFRFLIGFFCLWSRLPTTYALPGTNHALVYGESSRDTGRQH